MRSDVKIGTSLSGGLDSSSIVSMINELNNKKNKIEQYTFSARSKYKTFDETEYIDSVLKSMSKGKFVFPSQMVYSNNLMILHGIKMNLLGHKYICSMVSV